MKENRFLILADYLTECKVTRHGTPESVFEKVEECKKKGAYCIEVFDMELKR